MTTTTTDFAAEQHLDPPRHDPSSSLSSLSAPSSTTNNERTFSPDLTAYFRRVDSQLATQQMTHEEEEEVKAAPPSLSPPPLQPQHDQYESPSSVSTSTSTTATSIRRPPPAALDQMQFHESIQVAPASVTPPQQLTVRSIYSSQDSRVKFVSSYSLAVATCMKQSQLVKRDPKLIGKLLQYFIPNFISKYWFTSLLIVGIILTIELTHSRWLYSWTPLVLGVWLIIKLVLMRIRITTELAPNVPMHSFQFFKHARLIQRCKTLPVARLYNSTGNTNPGTPNGGMSTATQDIFFQPSEGYCGQATLNNVLGSIPFIGATRKFFVTLPMVVRPFSLTEMEKYIRQLMSASHLLASTIERVEILYDWTRPQPKLSDMHGEGYSDFLSTLTQQVNDPKYRFMINFLRTPLFFCQEAPDATHSSHHHSRPSNVSLARKLFSGHWSPLLGYLEPNEVERMMLRGGSGTPAQTNSPMTYPASPVIMPAPGLKNNLMSPVELAHTDEIIRAAHSSSDDSQSPTLVHTLTENVRDVINPDRISTAECVASAPASPVDRTPSIPGTVESESCLRNRCSGTNHAAHLTGPPLVPMQRATSDAVLHYANYLSATSNGHLTSLNLHASERQAMSEGLLLVADVNPSYGHYLIPPRRLYDAVNTVNLLDGGPRGIVRITLKSSPATATPPSNPN